MKQVVVYFATRNGQTQRIAAHVAALMREQGFSVEVQQVKGAECELSPGRYHGAVLAAPVHIGRHLPEFTQFVKDHISALYSLPTAFISVSLSQAGAENIESSPEKRSRAKEEVRRIIDEFVDRTGWHPTAVSPVAGALAYTKYNPLIRFVMRWIARKEGASTDTSCDHEFTDWRALDRFVHQFSRGIELPTGSTTDSVPVAEELAVASARTVPETRSSRGDNDK